VLLVVHADVLSCIQILHTEICQTSKRNYPKEFTWWHISGAFAMAPGRSIPLTRSNRPWWTGECQDAIQSRKKALRIYKSNPTPENLIRFRRLRAQARGIVRECKNSFGGFPHVWNGSLGHAVMYKVLRFYCSSNLLPNLLLKSS
jgi:hypothetical protein